MGKTNNVSFRIPKELRTTVRIKLAREGKTLQQYMCDLIKKDLGLEENSKGLNKWTDEEIICAFKNWILENKRIPNYSDKLGKYMPSCMTVYRRFDRNMRDFYDDLIKPDLPPEQQI